MIDPPVTLAVIEAIFGSPDFTSGGYGGDFVIPGCVEYLIPGNIDVIQIHQFAPVVGSTYVCMTYLPPG